MADVFAQTAPAAAAFVALLLAHFAWKKFSGSPTKLDGRRESAKTAWTAVLDAGAPIPFLLVMAAQVIVHYGLGRKAKHWAMARGASRLHPSGDAGRMLSYVTHIFVHWDDLHLWGNLLFHMPPAWALWLGRRSSRRANAVLIWTYLSSGVAGCVLSSAMYPNEYRILGSSGSSSSLLGLCLAKAGELCIWKKATSTKQAPRIGYLILLAVSVLLAAAQVVLDLKDIRDSTKCTELAHLSCVVIGIIVGVSARIVDWLNE